MAKVIRTKYLGWTNRRPNRIKASAEGVKPLIVNYDDDMDPECNHREVAKALAVRQGWTGEYVGGTLTNGENVYVKIGGLEGSFYVENMAG